MSWAEPPYRAETIAPGLAGQESLTGFLADPGGPARPAILLLHEIFGVNLFMQAEALAWAREGYLAFAPDLFHRLEPQVALPYTDAARAHGIGLWDRLDDGPAVADCLALAGWLRQHPRCSGQVAGVGFCLGGKLIVLAASALDAVVSFYPVRMQEQRQVMQAATTPIQMQLGADDGHVPPEVIAMMRADLGSRACHRIEVHPGAGHGFYNAFRHFGFHGAAAAKAGDQARGFLAARLASAGSADAMQG